MTPIIIPIQNTKVVDCIVQNGVRYCEKADITNHETGVLTLSVSGIIIWLALWLWIGMKVEDSTGLFVSLPIAILGAFVIPGPIIGLFLI